MKNKLRNILLVSSCLVLSTGYCFASDSANEVQRNLDIVWVLLW